MTLVLVISLSLSQYQILAIPALIDKLQSTISVKPNLQPLCSTNISSILSLIDASTRRSAHVDAAASSQRPRPKPYFKPREQASIEEKVEEKRMKNFLYTTVRARNVSNDDESHVRVPALRRVFMYKTLYINTDSFERTLSWRREKAQLFGNKEKEGPG